MVDSLPIFYTGNPSSEKALVEVEAEIKNIKKRRQDGDILIEAYKDELKLLKGKRQKILSKPKRLGMERSFLCQFDRQQT